MQQKRGGVARGDRFVTGLNLFRIVTAPMGQDSGLGTRKPGIGLRAGGRALGPRRLGCHVSRFVPHCHTSRGSGFSARKSGIEFRASGVEPMAPQELESSVPVSDPMDIRTLVFN